MRIQIETGSDGYVCRWRDEDLRISREDAPTRLRAWFLARNHFREIAIEQARSKLGDAYALDVRRALSPWSWLIPTAAFFVGICGGFLIDAIRDHHVNASVENWTRQEVVAWCASTLTAENLQIALIFDRCERERIPDAMAKATVFASGQVNDRDGFPRPHVVAARRYLLSWPETRRTAEIRAQAHSQGFTPAQLVAKCEGLFE